MYAHLKKYKPDIFFYRKEGSTQQADDVIRRERVAERAFFSKSNFMLLRPGFYTGAIITIAVLTALGIGLGTIITPIDQAMIYLMGGVFIAIKLGRGSALLYSLVSVSCLNFFFIPPIYSFDIYDRSYWLTLVVMLMTSIVITGQASRLRLQAGFAFKREQDTQNLYTLTRELASSYSRQNICIVAANKINKMFDVSALIALPDEDGQVKPRTGEIHIDNAEKEGSVLQWCFDNGQIAGRHTMTMPSISSLYLPLITSSGTLGVLGVTTQNAERHFSDDELSSLETCASLLASALDRAKSMEMAEKSKLEVESEKLRTMLLSSVSHDLRSPLASITGAASTIATDIDQLSRDTIRDLGQSINKEAGRLSHLVTNLLEATRLESDGVQLNRQPYFIEELIGSALGRLEHILSKHKIIPQSDEGLPLVFADGSMIEQVLTNLLENAAHYTPAGSTISISAVKKDQAVLVTIKDNGPGIAAGEERKIFDKFYSISRVGSTKGTGLGLAICACIIKLHNGEIWAENLSQEGASFSFTLPAVVHEAQIEVSHVNC